MRSEAQAAEDRQEREDEQANRRYSLWLSIVTVAVLCLQVWLLVNQNTIINKQTAILKNQEQHMRDGLVETKKAAEATKLSADTAATALHLTQRAHLFVDNWSMNEIKAGEKLMVYLHVGNSGQTPARVTQKFSRVMICDVLDGVPGEPLYTPMLPTNVVIAQHRSQRRVEFSASIVTPDELNKFMVGSAFILVYGQFNYVDAFGREHYTRFGNMFLPSEVSAGWRKVDQAPYQDAD